VSSYGCSVSGGLSGSDPSRVQAQILQAPRAGINSGFLKASLRNDFRKRRGEAIVSDRSGERRDLSRETR
jgi:hypothetical protein